MIDILNINLRQMLFVAVASLILLSPDLASTQPIGHTSIAEEALTGFGSQDVGLVLPPEVAQNLLERGTPSLALRIANEVLDRSGADLLTAKWTKVQVGALIALDRHTQALTILEGLPPQIFDSQPTLWLFMADSYLATNSFTKARDSYSKFMVQHGGHPQQFAAQRGLGLTALAAGEIAEAELLLNIYAQESDRPRPDALLIIALGKLANLKGDDGAADSYLTHLASIKLSAKDLNYRQRIEALVLWHIQNQRWQQGFALVEEGLQTKPSPGLRHFYEGLVSKWMVTYHAKKKGFDTSILVGIQTFMRGGADPKKREAALDLLLEKELKNPIGLFQESGVLASGSFLPRPFDPLLRMLLAKAHLRLQNGEEAWRLLRGLPGARSVQLRLRVMAAGLQPKYVDLVEQLRQPIPMEGEMVREVVATMFAFTKRNELAAAAQLRQLLSRLSKQVAVRRALRFQQAMDKALNGEKSSALTLYLELAAETEKDMSRAEINTYLPMDPKDAAADILVGQGAFIEAIELRKLK
ncbi:MAG: hypothetical protein HQL70_03635 [Magnetococcales bacterium]|nr:hypothetical protein [Magnetococcales bacterium]